METTIVCWGYINEPSSKPPSHFHAASWNPSTMATKTRQEAKDKVDGLVSTESWTVEAKTTPRTRLLSVTLGSFSYPLPAVVQTVFTKS